MLRFIRVFFSVDRLLRADKRMGEIPATRTAYLEVINIAVPSVIEMVLVSLVGMINTVMVSSNGYEAIAAVGLTGQPRMLILSVFMALNVGVTAVVARRRGEERQGKANEALRNALVLIVVLSAVLTAAALLLTEPLMRLAGAQDDTIGLASTYFFIISSVLPLNAVTLCINAAQRGAGNMRVTMYVNILSNSVNIILNWLLINGNLGFPRLGVTGAGIATMIGFVAGFILSVHSVTSRRSVGRFLHVSFRHNDWRLKKDALRAIGKVSGSAMVEQLALRVGFMIYARQVADLGTIAFAAHQIGMQFLNISFSFGDGIGVAGTSLVGQLLGRGRQDLAMLYGKVSQRMALVVALSLGITVILLRYPLVSMFTDEPEVFTLVVQLMFIIAVFQPFQTSSVVISGALRGAGDTRYVALIMLLCVSLIRPLLTFVGIQIIGLGLIGAWSASLVDMSVRVVCVYRRFSSDKWFDIKV